MAGKNYINRFALVMAGLAMALSFFLFLGAAPQENNLVGRYQLEVVVRNSFPDLYVIDTMTGKVKWVDSKNENKPFDQIR